MNSKEALEKLYDGYQNGMAGRSFYDIIKQDLKVLEILKKYIIISKSCDDDIFPYDIDIKQQYISSNKEE